MKRILLTLVSLTTFFNIAFAQWPTYCTPSVTNSNSSIGIRNVNFNSGQVDNTTGLISGYADYTNLSFGATAGGTVDFSILNGTTNNHALRIFVDYDRNGVFGQSAPELVFSRLNYPANNTTINSFIVPALTQPGAYRVRVKGEFSSGSNDPCASSYGDFEDYTMVVTNSVVDAQALTLTSPALLSLGNNNLTLRMANLSNVTMTSVRIAYQLDNNTPVMQTISSLSVPSGRVYDAVFSTVLNVPTPGNYDLKVWVEEINGTPFTSPLNNNDSLYFNFTACNPISGNYTIGGAPGPTNFANFADAVNVLDPYNLDKNLGRV